MGLLMIIKFCRAIISVEGDKDVFYASLALPCHWLDSIILLCACGYEFSIQFHFNWSVFSREWIEWPSILCSIYLAFHTSSVVEWREVGDKRVYKWTVLMWLILGHIKRRIEKIGTYIRMLELAFGLSIQFGMIGLECN